MANQQDLLQVAVKPESDDALLRQRNSAQDELTQLNKDKKTAADQQQLNRQAQKEWSSREVKARQELAQRETADRTRNAAQNSTARINARRLDRETRIDDQLNERSIVRSQRLLQDLNKIYNTNNTVENWYQAMPYSFRLEFPQSSVRTKSDGKQSIYRTIMCNLPISPSNLMINTIFATNVIATMGGVIEEHSDQRFFDIQIAGTTGLAPKYTSPIDFDSRQKDGVSPITTTAINDDKTLNSLNNKSAGRRAWSPINMGLLTSGLGGFFKRTQQAAQNIVNNISNVKSIFSGENGVYESAVDYNKTGYAAFHNFYRFLLFAKKKAAEGAGCRLYFSNYKDGNKYNVAIQDFTMTRSAEDPMLYHYVIRMRGYNLQSINAGAYESLNAQNSSRLADLGLDGVSNPSVLAKLSKGMRSGRNAAYSLLSLGKGGL